jgi:ABC-type glycerol-3-phosphate transport system substrate-binding protein
MRRQTGNGLMQSGGKALLLSLLMLLLLVVLTACSGNKDGGSGGADSQGEEAKSGGGDSGPFKFSYIRPTWGPATYTKGGAYEKELFERANVEIDVQIIPVVDFDATIRTTVAGGNMPDVVWGSGPTNSFWKDMQDQGAFLKINEYLDLFPAVKAAVPDGIWDMMADENGDIYFIPNLIYPVVPFFINYRADIFEQLNIPEPKTIRELEAALEKIRDSGLGITPMTHGNTHAYWAAKDIGTSFGSVYGWAPSKEDPNKLVPKEAQEEYLNFKFWLQDMKRRGLFDEEAGVNPDPAFGETKFKAGKAAVILGGGMQSLIVDLRKNVPNADIKIMPPLEGPDGTPGGTRVVFPQDRGFYINAKSKDKAENFFKFLNWTLTDGSDFRRYGIEGKTYTVDAQGRKVPIPNEEREKDYQGAQIEPLKFIDPMSEKLDWEAVELSFIGSGIPDKFEYYKQMFETYAKVTYYDYKDPTILSPTEAEIGAQIWEDYMAKVDGSVLVDMNVTREDYKAAYQRWLDAGGQKIIDEVNEMQKDKSKPNFID